MKSDKMKSAKIAGIIITLVGLASLAVNAWDYPGNVNHRYITSGGGLIFCIIGAVLIRKSRTASENEK